MGNRRFEATFTRIFEGCDNECDAHDQLHDYLTDCVKDGEVVAFNFTELPLYEAYYCLTNEGMIAAIGKYTGISDAIDAAESAYPQSVWIFSQTDADAYVAKLTTLKTEFA